jgi:hypothetical protein
VDDVLGGDGPEEVPAATVEDLRRFSKAAQDPDPDVMERAWS